jgi:hypothetical protein
LPIVHYLFLEAISSYPLYLFCYGFRFAPAATKKDAVSIWAIVSGNGDFESLIINRFPQTFSSIETGFSPFFSLEYADWF